jgi:glycosyltransferase involved in cell wall biosynthesis
MKRAKVHFICNGIFGTNVAGGDIHFLKSAQATADAGYELNYFGGQAVRKIIETYNLPGTVTLTDDESLGEIDQGSLRGQLAMFWDFYKRCRRTIELSGRIAPDDFVHGTSDYWFDAIPVVRCPARRKMMIAHMEAPGLMQIIRRSRPDVDARRLASLHLFLSQKYALARFRSCRNKRLLYVHPDMKPAFLRMGYDKSELFFTSEGFDLTAAENTPVQGKQFDVIWIGRVHRQKGIEDLLATLTFLADKMPDFRALLVGNVEAKLRPKIAALGLQKQVAFAGVVLSEMEKSRLLKSSRLFLMPSNFESWGIVIAEALAAGLPVVAYELEAYRPIFGNLLHYVQPFDLAAFQQAALDVLTRARGGQVQGDTIGLEVFKQEHSWTAMQKRFLQALNSFGDD